MLTKTDHPDAPSAQGREYITIAKGAGTIFAGMIVGTGLKYLFQIVVARNLGPQLYGLFILGLAVFNVVAMLAECGFAKGVVRFVALYRGERDERRVKGTVLLALKWTLVSGSLMTLTLAALAHPVAVHFFHKPELSGVLRMFSLGILFSALTAIFVSATQGFKIMTYSVLVKEIFEPAARVGLVCFVFLAMGSKLSGVLGAYLIPVGLSAVLAYYYFKKTFPAIRQKDVSPVFDKKQFLDFSLPMLFVQFFGLWTLSIDTLMLGYFKTSQEVGIYSAAQKTALVGNIIFVSFSSIFAPIAADLHNRKELPMLSLYYKTVTKWIFALSLPLYLILILGADSFLLIFGKDFVQARSSLIVLSLGWIAYSATNSASQMLVMSGRQKLRVMNMTGLLGLTFFLNLILIPRHGLVGAAFSISISLGLFGLTELGQVYFLLKVHPYRKDFLKPIAAGAVTFLLFSLVMKAKPGAAPPSLLWLLIEVLLFLAVYGGLILIAGVQPEDKLVLRRIKEKFWGGR